MHPQVVQELLGHGQISIMMDLYSNVISAMQKELMTRLDDILEYGGQKECYATLAEVYFRQFAIDYYTRLVLEIPKNEARLVNTDSMRNCINWR